MATASARPTRRFRPRPAAGGITARPRSALVVVLALTVLAFALRVRGMGEGLFGDELYSLTEIRDRNFGAMLDAVANGVGGGVPLENTPPLYFVLAWLSAKVGDPLSWIRLPSVVFGTATVPVVFLLGRRTLGRRAALVAAAFVALSPFAVFYGIEARAYALSMFLCALSTLALLTAVDTGRDRWWVAYAATVAALLYTQYTGVLVVAVHAAWILWYHRDRWRPLVLSYLTVAGVYAVWLPYIHSDPADFGVLAALIGVGYGDAFLQWLAGFPALQPADMPGTLALVLLAGGVGVGLLGALASARGREGARDSSGGLSPPRVLILALAAVTPLFSLVYGIFSTDLFLFPRNMITSLPFAALALGWALTPPVRVMRIAAVALAGVGVGLAAIRTLADEFHRPNFPAVARLLDDRAGPRTPVVVFGEGFQPFIVADALRPHLDRRHAVHGADTSEGAVARGFETGGGAPRRGFLVELQQREGLLPPAVRGWKKVEQRVYPGSPPLIVAVYDRRAASGPRS